MLPQPEVDATPGGSAADPGEESEPGDLGNESGLGALNPGDRTRVGGSLAESDSAFRSQNAEVHFTVRSLTAAYWRTGVYDTHTGAGWKRSDEPTPYAGPIDGRGIAAERVELARSATAGSPTG